jgi:DHA2 family multidrug resistance protein
MNEALARMHEHGIAGTKAYGLLTGNLVQQAYLLSSNDIFWLSGWLALACIPLVWLARRSISGGGPVAAD